MDKIINGILRPWSEGLDEALEKLNNGKNTFVSGEGGTGKSTLISAYADSYTGELLICATTGCAAVNVTGMTAHKAFKINNDPMSAKNYRIRLENSAGGICKYDCIIIDEVSMLRQDVFDYICNVIDLANTKRLKDIQLILVGDFYQLPPVINKDEKNAFYKKYGNQTGFAFNSEKWKEQNFQYVILKEQLRQADDLEYASNLSKIRQGEMIDDETIDYFNQKADTKFRKSDTVVLFPRRKAAKNENECELKKIEGQEIIYNAEEKFIDEEMKKKKYSTDCPVEMDLKLKIGAKVMVKTNSKKYYNGKIGIVTKCKVDRITVRWEDNTESVIFKQEWPIYDILRNNRTQIGTIVQFPLILAYAITIHNSQGLTFESAIVDPTCFAEGQLYVALSRVKSFDGLHLLGKIERKYIKVSAEVQEFYMKIA